MLLRRIGVRQGRKALSTPIARPLIRRLTVDQSSGTTGREPPKATDTEQSQAPQVDLQEVYTEAGEKQIRLDAEFFRNRPFQPAGVPPKLGAPPSNLPEALSSTRPRVTPAVRHGAAIRKSEVTMAVGSDVRKTYEPKWLLENPPEPKHVSLEALMASQTHMGHHTSLWNPENSRYIYGVRNGIHIISLEMTAAHLRRAATVVEEVSYRAGLILFVGTRKGHRRIVTNSAGLSGSCHLFTKWTPGAITNRDIILRDKELRIVNEHDESLPGFDRHIRNTRPITPDLVICLNPIENFTLLYECGLAGIPTIGVIDTDADPSWVTYTIPANDDSLRSIAFIAGVLGQAAKQGKERRLKAAKEVNLVTWQTPNDVKNFMQSMVKRRSKLLNDLMEKQKPALTADTEKATNTAQDKPWFNEEEEEEDLEQLARELGWAKDTNGEAVKALLEEDPEFKQFAAETEAVAELSEQEAISELTEEKLMKELAEDVELASEGEEGVVPEKDIDEGTRQAEANVLEELDASSPEAAESETELNERMMKQVNVEKGVDGEAVSIDKTVEEVPETAEGAAAVETSVTTAPKEEVPEEAQAKDAPKADAPKDDDTQKEK